MKLVIHKSFQKAFQRLIKKNSPLEKKILAILDILENDPFTPSLKSHKLKGNLSDYWSCFFSQDENSEETLIILVDIGSHDEVY